MFRRALLLSVAAAAFGVAWTDASAAYPDRAVKLIVPFAPGSSVGIAAQKVKQAM